MAYEQGLKSLNQVHLSRLSPVMWTTRGGYPRQTLSTKIGPLDMSMGSFDRRYAPVTGWNRYNSIANLRPIGFGGLGLSFLPRNGGEFLAAIIFVAACAAGARLFFDLWDRWA